MDAWHVRYFSLCFACLLACSTPTSAPAPATNPAPVPPAQPPPEPERVEVTDTASVLQDDADMSMCMDIERRYTGIKGEDWKPPSLNEHAADIAKGVGMVLAKTCAEQFPGRPVLATCTMSKNITSKTNGREGRLRHVSNFYTYAEAFESRENMRECLKAGAEWSSVSEDSPEYRRARLDRHAKALLK